MTSPDNGKKYDHKAIEQKWQKHWEDTGIHKIEDEVKGKENFYQLVEFSYPSGDLHTGHWYAFAVPDIYARYKRMQGFNVLYPMGFDAFGLPAENAAIKNGGDPREWTENQMSRMRTQIKSMGATFDWSREVVTCDPAYYKWTQWMFTQFFKNDLVYRANTKVNWCPKDQTILANEQVIDGKCDRCGTEVIQKDQDQWMLRITKYADRLIDDLEGLDWPNAIKESQKNWISRSEGALIDFPVKRQPEHPIKVFTTRPDTIFGVTFIAVSAGLAKKWFEMGWNASQDVKNYVEATLKEQSVRDFKEKEKTGIFAGFNAINPANKEEIPVWITNYVLSDIGTGAIMAVPAHDERDFDFAKKYDLPIRFVIAKPAIEIAKGEIEKRDGSVSIVENEKGEIIVLQNSANMDHFLFPQGGIENNESALECAIREVREESGFNDISLVSELGCDENYFEMRNGLTRHRITYSYHFKLNSNSNSGQDLDEAESEFIVHWMSPKEAINKVNVRNHKIFLERYLGINSICFPNEGILTNSNEFNGLTSEEAKKKIVEFVGGEMTKTYKLRDWGISRQRYWGTPIPVVYDLNGKAHPVPEEHLPWTLPTDVDHTPDGTAPLARSKELFERTEKIFGKGWKPEVETMDTFVDSSWYFYRYLDNKNDQEFASKEKMKAWMPIDLYMGGAEHTTMHLLYSRFWVKALNDLGLVKENEAYKIRRNRGLILAPDGQKMSKSKGNAISPDEIVDRLGADTVRMYLAFMGPYGVTTNYPWDPNGVVGVRRFLERVWKLTAKIDVDKKTCRTDNIVQKTIKGVGEDMEDFKFNTAIAKMMTLINEFEKEEKIVLSSYKILLKLLAPFAPHISEELWQELGEKESIHLSSWPIYDTSLVVDEEVTIGVQINGKLRDEITISRDADKDTIEKLALALPKIKGYIDGKKILKIVVVPNRIINIVIS